MQRVVWRKTKTKLIDLFEEDLIQRMRSIFTRPYGVAQFIVKFKYDEEWLTSQRGRLDFFEHEEDSGDPSEQDCG